VAPADVIVCKVLQVYTDSESNYRVELSAKNYCPPQYIADRKQAVEGSIQALNVRLEALASGQDQEKRELRVQRQQTLQATASLDPIMLGREYRIAAVNFRGLSWTRQLGALRSLCHIQYPLWSEFFWQDESSSLKFHFHRKMRVVLLGTPTESRDAALDVMQEPYDKTEWARMLVKTHDWCGKLNEWQLCAVDRALQCRVSIIQGPPGTGKTLTAVALIAAWRMQNPDKPVLAATESNVAADNLHSMCCSKGIRSERLVSEDPGTSKRKELQAADVVVCTLTGTARPLLAKKKFGLLIIDECAQATEANSIVAIGRGCKQLCLLGDKNQLGPFVQSWFSKTRLGAHIGLQQRLLEVSKVVSVVLQEQKRMHPSIVEFPNRRFYGNEIVTVARKFDCPDITGFVFPNPDCRVCLVDTGDQDVKEDGKYSNSVHALHAVKILRQLVDAGNEPQDIAIIAPWLEQVRKLRKEAKQELQDLASDVKIGTVDAYQGQESKIVIFTITRFNETGEMGFLGEPQRINVALTRAQHGLIVIGSLGFLKVGSSANWADWATWIQDCGSVVSANSIYRQRPPPRLEWSQVDTVAKRLDDFLKSPQESRTFSVVSPGEKQELIRRARERQLYTRPQKDRGDVLYVSKRKGAPERRGVMDSSQGSIVVAELDKASRLMLVDLFKQHVGIPKGFDLHAKWMPICAGTMPKPEPFTSVPGESAKSRALVRKSSALFGKETELTVWSWTQTSTLLVAGVSDSGCPSMSVNPHIIVASAPGEPVDAAAVDNAVCTWKDLPESATVTAWIKSISMHAD